MPRTRIVQSCHVALVLALLGIASAGSFAGDAKKPRKDADGDLLPDGAVARLGSMRWRHGEPITFIAAPPDGKTLITAGQDTVLRLWDRETGKELRRFVPPVDAGAKGVPQNTYMQGLTRAAMSRDGKRLAVILANNVVQLWETESGKALRQVKTTVNGVASMAFAPDGKTLFVRSVNDRVAFVYEVETGKETRKLKAAAPPDRKGNIFGGAGDGTAIALSADGKTIALSELEWDGQRVSGSVTLFNMETGKEIHRIDSQTNGISSVVFSPDAKTIVFNTHNAIHVHSAETGKELRQIRANNGVLLMIASPTEPTIAVKGRDHILRLFNIDTGNLIRTIGELPGPRARNGQRFWTNPNGAITTDVVYSTDGKTLIIGGQHLPRFFDVATGTEQLLAGGGHRGAVTAMSATVDGKSVISRGADGVLRIWDVAAQKEIRQFPEPIAASAVQFAPNGKLVAIAMNDGTVSLLDVADGKQKRQFKAHQGVIATIAFSADGKQLATRGAYDGLLHVFDAETGANIKKITFHEFQASDAPVLIRTGFGRRDNQPLAYSPDGKMLAVYIAPQQVLSQGRQQMAPDSNSLRVFSTETGKEIRRMPLTESRTIHQLTFSIDGRLLICENSDLTITLWEVASGQERSRFGDAVTPAAQTTFNSFIVNPGRNGPAMAPTGVTLAISPDGALIAAPGANNTVRVYDAMRSKLLSTYAGHSGPTASLEFAADGKTLLSGGNDATLLVWDLSRLKREPRPLAVAIAPQDFQRLWGDLVNSDAVKAGQAIQTLIDGADEAVGLLKNRIQPAVDADPKKVEQWIRDLDSRNFKNRAIAAKELDKLGELAIPALRKALASNPSIETRRRLEPMLDELTGSQLTAEQIRVVRAVEVLDKIGSAEARKVLERLASGAPGSLTTRQAQSALERGARK
jgi:WD40 repeat protein